MTGRFDAAYYEDIRGRVRGVLIAVSAAFAPEQLGLVEELIDANEAGVALEMLIEMLVEAGVPIVRTIIDQITTLVQEMSLPASTAQQVKKLRAT